MPSRIRIGPDGGPYVIVEENNGDLDITTPDDTIDLQNSGLINAALSGVLDAQNNDISNVGALTADSVSTAQLNNDISDAALQSAFDGLIVPVAEGLGMLDAIKPSSTTPIQDAVDAINTSSTFDSGQILLPDDTTIQTSGGITGADNIHFKGVSKNSVIQRTDPSNNLFDVSTGQNANNLKFSRLALDGNNDTGGAPCFDFSNALIEGFDLRNVSIKEFHATGATEGIITFSGGGVQGDWTTVSFDNNHGNQIHSETSAGGFITFNKLLFNADTEDRQIQIKQGGPGMAGKFIQVVGDASSAVDHFAGAPFVVSGSITYRPDSAPSTVSVINVGAGGGRKKRIEHITVEGSTDINEIVRIANGCDNLYVGTLHTGTGAVNNNYINIAGTPNANIQIGMNVSFFDNPAVSQETAVYSIEDQVYVDPKIPSAVVPANGSYGTATTGLTAKEYEPQVQSISIIDSTPPSTDFSFDHYAEWNQTTGEWEIKVAFRNATPTVDTDVRLRVVPGRPNIVQ